MLGNLARDASATPASPLSRREAPIIEVAGLVKRFVVQGRTHTVLDAFDFAVEPGSFVSIVGPSGCGKSTLLKLMAGLDSANGGKIMFKDRPVQEPPRGVIYVFQQYTKSIFPWRTVFENVAFGSSTSAASARRAGDSFAATISVLSGWKDTRTITLRSFPAACNSVWRSLGRSCASPTC